MKHYIMLRPNFEGFCL